MNGRVAKRLRRKALKTAKHPDSHLDSYYGTVRYAKNTPVRVYRDLKKAYRTGRS